MQSSWRAGVPTISMQKHFYDGSGKLERLRLNILLPGVAPQRVRNLQLFASFKYLLTEKLNIEMAGMSHIDLDTPNGVAKARVSGNLEFDQASPILIDSITRTLFVKNPLNSEDYANIGLPGILEHYFDRSGKFLYSAPKLKSLLVCAEKLRYNYQWLVQPLGSQYKTEMIIDVNIPI